METKTENNIILGYLAFIMLLTLLTPFIPLEYFTLFMLALIIYDLQHNQKSKLASPLMGLYSSVFAMGVISILMKYTGYEFPLYIFSGSIAIACAGGTVAGFIRRKNKHNAQDIKFISATSSIALIVVGAFSASVISYWIITWMEIQVTMSQLFFLTVIGAVACALLESIPSRTDKYFTQILGTGMVMWLFASFGYYVNFTHLSAAFMFSLLLAYLAYRLDVADVSAMLAATLLGILIIVFTNFNWYLILIAFFLLGGGFTRYRYDYKVERGMAQSKGGIRSYENVLSNSLTALILAVCYGVYHNLYPQFIDVLLFAYLGAVATATGDTLASEIGQTCSERPIMITTLKSTRPGTDGAISLLGEKASFGGSLVIGLLALVLGVFNMYPSGFVDNTIWVFIVVIGGIIGTNFDSLLGATLQQRGWLSNSGVNLIATMGGAFISGAVYYLLQGHVV